MPIQFSGPGPFDQASHASLITMAYTLALLRTRADWTSRDCCRHECVGRAERGDSAHGPHAQRRTAAQIHTQAGMKRQARRPLNRIRSHRIGKVWYRVGVLYRSEQRGGRRPETASKSDSPIMVAQAGVITLKMT